MKFSQALTTLDTRLLLALVDVQITGREMGIKNKHWHIYDGQICNEV